MRIGLLGAASAAVTGLTDWHKTDGRARRVGIVHGVLNLTATALYATSLVLRLSKKREAARAAAWLGFAVMGSAGYVGGVLVYSEKAGTDHANHKPLPSGFVAVLAEGDLQENTPRLVEVEGVRIVLVRQNEVI